MDSKLLLLQSIMLLYWESRLTTEAEKSVKTVRDIVATIELPLATMDGDVERSIIQGLQNTANYLCSQVERGAVDKEELLQRIKLSTSKDPELVGIIADGMTEVIDEDAVQAKVSTYAKSIIEYQKEKGLKELMRGLQSRILYSKDSKPLNVKQLALEIQQSLDPFTVETKGTGPLGIPGVLGMVNFMDEESVNNLFETAEDETSLDGILKTGYQHLNRMLGDHQGFRRGNFWFVAAPQHCYKTGYTLNLTKQIALYNKPHMLDETKKPLILHITSENEISDNLLDTYRSLKENETHEVCDIHSIDRDEATAYVMSKTNINGYHLHMLRVNPSEFTLRSYMDLIIQYELDGYEIHVATIDYLNMFNKEGCDGGNITGGESRDLFRRTRNFNSARKILTLTPHQLSSEVKYLIRQDIPLLAKELVGKSYWDSCKTIDQEADGILILYIEKYKGRKYLTVALDKHRKSGPVTPEKDRFAIIPFFDAGAIRDDLLGEDLSIDKLGADIEDEGGDWYE